MSAPCLALVDFASDELKLEVHTDASKCALEGAFLARVEDVWRPVAYHSRKLNPDKVNHSDTDRELLAVVDCLRSFHPYVLGC